MMVDEVQDMSTIQLILLNKLANRLVMIGDVDQQIYGFRGASSSTIACIKSMRPDIIRCDLTVSFRCTEQIAELARSIIAPNNYGTESMKTVREGVKPEIIEEGTNYIVDKIAKKFYANNEKFVESQMILYRNNYSAYEVVSKLYDRGVPVRNTKYISFKDMPKIRNIFNLILYVKDQKNHSKYGYLLKEFLPELARKSDMLQKTFQDPNLANTPFLQLQLALSNYEEVRNFFDTVSYLEEEIVLDGSAFDIFIELYNMYLKNGLRDYYEFTGTDPDKIASLAKEIMGSKTLSQFIISEEDKSFSILAWTKDNYGIECMTMHSSKGTEADEVYILDTGSDTIPNEKRLARYIQADSLEEMDNYLNNERSLLFVAVTRAKDSLVIQYDGDLTKLICDPYNEVLAHRGSSENKENEAERIIRGFNGFVERTKIK